MDSYVDLATSDFTRNETIQFGGYENWKIALVVLLILAIAFGLYKYYYNVQPAVEQQQQ